MTENTYRRFITDTTPGSPTYRQSIQVDMYDVLRAFGVSDPAIQHAIKKLFRAGQGAKSERQDLEEAIVSIQRVIDALPPEPKSTWAPN